MNKQDKIMALGLITMFGAIFLTPILQAFLPKASFWSFTSKIEIDDTNPLKSWNHTASTYDWCRGNGTWVNPYIIENVTINIASNIPDPLSIKNSNVYFIIRNLTIIGGQHGIFMDNVSNGFILDTEIKNGFYGIRMRNSVNNTIMNNKIHHSFNYGIQIRHGSLNRLFGNEIYNHIDGVSLLQTNTNNITNNIVHTLSITGIKSILGFNNYIAFNNISNTVFYGIEVRNTNTDFLEGNNIRSGAEGIRYKIANSNKAISNNISDCNIGIRVDQSISVTLNDNLISNNTVGILILPFSAFTKINNSLIDDNSMGIHVSGSDLNTITYSNFTNNALGLFLDSTSVTNTFLFNYFNNTANANDNNTAGVNIFDNGTMGNFWSDYGGVDGNGDGIGDTPYNISGTAGSQDNFPIWFLNETGAENGNGNVTITPPTTPTITPEELTAFEKWVRDNWILILILSIGIPIGVIASVLIYRRYYRRPETSQNKQRISFIQTIKTRWEFATFGILGFISLIPLFVYNSVGLAELIRNISIDIFTLLQIGAMAVFLINSTYLIYLTIKLRREAMMESEQRESDTKSVFQFLYGITGTIFTLGLFIIAMLNTYYAFINNNTSELTIEFYHVPIILISLIQFIILTMYFRDLI